MIHPLRPEWFGPSTLAMCSRCSAVILTDDEGSNAAAHEAEHARTDEILQLLHRLADAAVTQREEYAAHAHGQDNGELTSLPVRLKRPAPAIERSEPDAPAVRVADGDFEDHHNAVADAQEADRLADLAAAEADAAGSEEL